MTDKLEARRKRAVLVLQVYSGSVAENENKLKENPATWLIGQEHVAATAPAFVNGSWWNDRRMV